MESQITDADRAAAEELCPAIDDRDTQRAARVTNVAAIIARHRADRGYILRPADDAQRNADAIRALDRVLQELSAVRREMSSQ